MGNISRTPMRDALGRLEQEGLITILPKKGLMVSGITEEDVHSMFEMRLLVEPYALRTYGSSIPREKLEAYAELMHHPDQHRGLLRVGRRVPRTADEHPAQQVSALVPTIASLA